MMCSNVPKGHHSRNQERSIQWASLWLNVAWLIGQASNPAKKPLVDAAGSKGILHNQLRHGRCSEPDAVRRLQDLTAFKGLWPAILAVLMLCLPKTHAATFAVSL